MAIQYALYRNSFQKQQSDAEYVARVHHTAICDQKELIKIITSRNHTLTPALVEAVLEGYAGALEHALSQGMRIDTPVVKIQASIQGTFANNNERRYPERQPIVLKALPGARLKKLIKRLKVERVSAKRPCPEPEHLEDVFSDTKDQRITPRGVLRLRGKRLKFDPQDPQQGIFLLPAEGEPIRLADTITNVPSQLLLQTPDQLPPGEYTLEVRAIVGNSTKLRRGSLPYSLIVTPS